MTNTETLYTIALTRLPGLGLMQALDIYKRVGSALTIFEHSNDIKELIPDATPRLCESFKKSQEAIERAKVELDFTEKKKIKCLCYNDNDYPQRLKDCDDAPIVLYYMGNADLNQKRIVSIVGTRQCTQYGKDILRKFCAELKSYCPDALIISGLAYGIDICSHREALKNGYETVGVLAHGFQTIYPSVHRDTAIQMLGQGGLLTEYMSDIGPDKPHFVARNRIVAGISDATIVVESASHGGSLITAGLAQDYNRDVFTFPGNVNAQFSAGCNNLIRDNKASLITKAEDFVHAMTWDDESVKNEMQAQGIERNLFLQFTEEEQAIVNLLKKEDNQQLNLLAIKSGLPISRITAIMFELEMKGCVKLLPGGIYHLF